MAAKRTAKWGARGSRTKSSRKRSAPANPVQQKSRSNRPKKNSTCPIVGIGGSAGYRTIDNAVITLVELRGKK